MPRPAPFALATFLLLGTGLGAQPAPEFEPNDIPVEIEARLSEYGTPDFVRSWAIDAYADGRPDRLVQAAYSIGGGNAVVLRWFLFTEDGGRWPMLEELSFDAYGISGVEAIPGGHVITFYELLPGDARCCPSGETRLEVGF